MLSVVTPVTPVTLVALLAAVIAVLTGILGASFGLTLLDRLGIKDPVALGLAMGTTSHGQGTARALQENQETGAYSGLAMGVAALGCAVVVPLVAKLF